MRIWLVLQSALFSSALAQIVDLNEISFGVLAPAVKNQLEFYVQEDFANTNATVSTFVVRYKQCTDLISTRSNQCEFCKREKCQKRANTACSGAAGGVSINQEATECGASPAVCKVLKVGKTALRILLSQDNFKKRVNNVVKKTTDGIKKFIGRIRLPRISTLLRRIRLPRIRLPRIRLPRIRLPRIRLPRIRLPRIRLPRIRLPRIRLPRIRLPRIRLPRIRLPRIRLPRIRLPRIRLPRIRLLGFRIFKRKRRQTTEPTCEELTTNSDRACQFYKTQCETCAGLHHTDALQLLEEVCGVEFKTIYTDLKSQENRLARLEDIYDLSDTNVLNITRIQYDLSQYDVKVGGFHGVRVGYTLLGNPTTLVLKEPVNPLDPGKAAPVMALLLYEDLAP